MDNPPPRLYVLDENAEHCKNMSESEKELESTRTSSEGTNPNAAPPAALLEPEEHDEEVLMSEHIRKEQLLTRIKDETTIVRSIFAEFDG
jgi:DNA-directed RNA polymerase subunit H (RpoH/RPB5)